MIFGVITAVFALCFIFLMVPKGELLHNYRMSRRFMAFAYGIFSVLSMIEIIGNAENGATNLDISLFCMLVISSFEALLLLVALIALINPRRLNKRWITIELSIICTFSLIMLGVIVLPFPSHTRMVARFVFCAFFIAQIIRNYRSLLTQHKWAREQIDNYFSGQESRYLSWMKTAWILCISAGVAILFLQFFHSWFLFDLINLYLLVVFTWLAFKILNYVYVFNLVSQVMMPVEEAKSDSLSIEELEDPITRWVLNKRYLTPGITVVDMALELNTNRTYLSGYINNQKGMNFNTWINRLRIEEAQSILCYQPELSIVEISEMLGYAHSSSFVRQFSKVTNTTPSSWRKSINPYVSAES